MIDRKFVLKLIAFAVGSAALVLSAMPAEALSMKECSVKFKAAQNAGEVNGVSWSMFRKTQCSGTASDEAVKKTEPSDETVEQASGKSDKDQKKAETTAKADAGNATFPSTIAKKFESETPAKARMHTCLETYNVNKERGTLGGMRWIEKGGGYYKQCNAKLKSDG